jgi:hypothetical protein
MTAIAEHVLFVAPALQTGNANLQIGGLKDAIQKNGVPGLVTSHEFHLTELPWPIGKSG